MCKNEFEHKETKTSLAILCEAEIKEKIYGYMSKTFNSLKDYVDYNEYNENIEREEEKLRKQLAPEQIKILNNIMEYHRFSLYDVSILAYLSGVLDGKKSLKKIGISLKDILCSDMIHD